MEIKRLKAKDLPQMKELLKLFDVVFEMQETYQGAVPTDQYLMNFLDDEKHIVLVVVKDGKLIGGLVAYVLTKFERQRSEVYVYDLAVLEEYRRKGAATKLFRVLGQEAAKYEAWTIFVQADADDYDALAFYRSIMTTEIMAHHFDVILKQDEALDS